MLEIVRDVDDDFCFCLSASLHEQHVEPSFHLRTEEKKGREGKARGGWLGWAGLG